MADNNTFSTAGSHVLIGYAGFSGSLRDYLVARAGQLKALSTLMVNAASTVGEMDDELRSDLLWLSQMLTEEIADAVRQLGVGESCALSPPQPREEAAA